MRPRVGHIQFLNCLPLYHMLVRSGAVLEMDLYKDTPIALFRQLIGGRLDISPVPAIEYARHARDLLLLPDLTVSSNGRVMSILLVSKVPADKLQGRPVALTNTSATSQVLAKIILAEKFGAEPVYFECPPDLPEMFREADAALLIGDDALRACARPGRYLQYDLGAEWKELTGEAMVYAVWAVRRSYAEKHPDRVAMVYEAFQRSITESLEQVDAIARDIARWEPFTAAFLRKYFKGLQYSFGPEYRAGFKTYLARAKKIGALDRIPKLEFARCTAKRLS
jgi:chorismate dehydratase